MSLLKVVTVEHALGELKNRFSDRGLKSEIIPVYDAFDRSTMDGYALRASETSCASDTIPSLFRSAGEVAMGKAPGFTLQPGEAASW